MIGPKKLPIPVKSVICCSTSIVEVIGSLRYLEISTTSQREHVCNPLFRDSHQMWRHISSEALTYFIRRRHVPAEGGPNCGYNTVGQHPPHSLPDGGASWVVQIGWGRRAVPRAYRSPLRSSCKRDEQPQQTGPILVIRPLMSIRRVKAVVKLLHRRI